MDSYNLSTGTGLLVLAACDMVKEGMPALDIVSRLEEMRGRVRASFILDTLEYLWKGGRCSGITALGANLLKLKPCIEVRDGKMGVGKKFRGNLSNVMGAVHHYPSGRGPSGTQTRFYHPFGY